MKALIKQQDLYGLQLFETDQPTLRKGEVLIRVKNVGICGSDLPIYENRRKLSVPRLILGHEIIGFIADANGSSFTIGERVAVAMIISCQKCSACIAGFPQNCSSKQKLGISRDGGFAEYVSAPMNNIVSLSDEINPTKLGVLIDPLACVIHGIRLWMQTGKSATDLIILGGGTMGHLAAKVVQRWFPGSKISLVDHHIERLQILRGEGLYELATNIAQLSVNSTSLVVEACGDSETLSDAIKRLRFRGSLLLFGRFLSDVSFPIDPFIRNEMLAVGSADYTIDDFREAAQLLPSLKLDADRLIPYTFRLEDYENAFQKARGKEFLRTAFDVQ